MARISSIYQTHLFFLSKCSSAMAARDNSKVLPQLPFDEQEQHTNYPYYSYPSSICLLPLNSHTHFSNFCPLLSAMELKNAPRGSSLTRSEDSPGDCSDLLGENSCAKSDSDSSSEVDADVSDEEVSLDEFLHDGKAKKKIELLASMVGVNSKEPVIVLTEVVRILKRLQRINQYYFSA